jgi:hypothetical protein
MKFKFENKDPAGTVTYELDEVTCTEVVRGFYYFLLGASFHKDSIVSAFQTIVEEHETCADTFQD